MLTIMMSDLTAAIASSPLLFGGLGVGVVAVIGYLLTRWPEFFLTASIGLVYATMALISR